MLHKDKEQAFSSHEELKKKKTQTRDRLRAT